MSEWLEFDEEPCCHESGRCQAMAGERGITGCIHCGKELHEYGGYWWTWDAVLYPSPKPQCAVIP